MSFPIVKADLNYKMSGMDMFEKDSSTGALQMQWFYAFSSNIILTTLSIHLGSAQCKPARDLRLKNLNPKLD